VFKAVVEGVSRHLGNALSVRNGSGRAGKWTSVSPWCGDGGPAQLKWRGRVMFWTVGLGETCAKCLNFKRFLNPRFLN